MLYDTKLGRPHNYLDCEQCARYNKRLQKCEGGYNVQCFEFDPYTQTVIDGVTKLPLRLEDIHNDET